ncbi:MAG: hypothetical protein G8345_06695 [Magnetococcales bacterium]|nr:hypothetical protein [Magnetococcales bacterium]NGZ26559.1 hypothetical protein [Magnetococcales bacterium]
MSKTLKIEVGTVEEAGHRFLSAWQAAEQGKTTMGEEVLSFGSFDLLLQGLTTRRWQILRSLKQHGPSSIRALSHRLGRDYKNVHTDVTALLAFGLLDRDASGALVVPWDTITASIHLVEAA